MDILDIIHDQYSRLSRAQRKIADYILRQPEEACFSTLKELTETVNVTEVTVMNFTRRLGLDGYSGLKRELQNYIRLRLSPNEKISRALADAQDRSLDSVYDSFLENEQANLAMTYRNVSEEELRRAAQFLKHRRRVFLLGYDVSLPVVQFLRLRLHYLGFNATQLDFADPSQLLLTLTQAGPEDAFVGISFPNHSPEMTRVAQYLHSRQVPLLAITDQLTAPISVYSTQTIACATTDLLFYNTITAPISLINVLCAFLAMDEEVDLHETRKAVERAAAEVLPPPQPV